MRSVGQTRLVEMLRSRVDVDPALAQDTGEGRAAGTGQAAMGVHRKDKRGFVAQNRRSEPE
jgi:hypothetical protein